MKHVLFHKAEMLLSFRFKNIANGFALLLNNFFVQIKKRKAQLFAEELSPVRFAASHKTDQEYFHPPVPLKGRPRSNLSLFIFCVIIFVKFYTAREQKRLSGESL